MADFHDLCKIKRVAKQSKYNPYIMATSHDFNCETG